MNTVLEMALFLMRIIRSDQPFLIGANFNTMRRLIPFFVMKSTFAPNVNALVCSDTMVRGGPNGRSISSCKKLDFYRSVCRFSTYKWPRGDVLDFDEEVSLSFLAGT